MKEAVIRMETTARPTTDRSASPRLLKGLLLAITLVALLATTVILCQQDIENPSYVYMILDETGMQIIDGRPDGDRTTGLLDIRADNSSRDAQLLLVKGQQVQVADAQGATYLVTTRRETVSYTHLDVYKRQEFLLYHRGYTPPILPDCAVKSRER